MIYLDIFETSEEPTVDSVKVEVGSKKEAESILGDYESAFVGKEYIKRVHYCYHDERRPCEPEEL